MTTPATAAHVDTRVLDAEFCLPDDEEPVFEAPSSLVTLPRAKVGELFAQVSRDAIDPNKMWDLPYRHT